MILCVALTLVTTLLGACKLIVESGEGGSVSRLSNDSVCIGDSTCEFDTEQGFFDTFVATPEEGFEFHRWVGYGPCEEDTTGICEVMFDTLPAELAVLLSAVELTLQAQFRLAGSNSDGGVNYDDGTNDDSSVNYDDGVNYNYTNSAPLDLAMKNFYILWEEQNGSRDSVKETSSI